jgi:FtsH-binding integral membrane protein
MAQYETVRSVGVGAGVRIDEGLRAHMNKVYGLMSVAMLVTAGVAWAISGLATTTNPAEAVMQLPNGTLVN